MILWIDLASEPVLDCRRAWIIYSEWASESGALRRELASPLREWVKVLRSFGEGEAAGELSGFGEGEGLDFVVLAFVLA